MNFIQIVRISRVTQVMYYECMCVLVWGSCQGLVFRYCLSAAAGSILCGLGLAWLSVFNRITSLNYAAAAVCV